MTAARCVFSTDANNSVLIRLRNLRWRVAFVRSDMQTETKQNEAKSGSAERKRHVSQEAFSPTICCCYSADIRSTHYRALCSRRPCRRQALDRLLGPLGARRQQGHRQTLVNEWAAKEKVEVHDRLHHLAGQQEPADHRRRSAGQVGPRHPGDPDLVAARARRAARAGQRRHGAAHQAERQRQRHRRVSRQGRRQVARRARHASAARSRGPARAST